MKDQVYVIDNFYEEPNKIRYLALQQGLGNHGYHPGMRTMPCFNREAHDKIVKILGSFIYPSGDCYSFQFNTENDVSWIHTDIAPGDLITNSLQQGYTYWAAVIYLTPNAPINCGTTLYNDKKYNKRGLNHILFNSVENSRSKSEKIIDELSDYGSDLSKWNNSTTIGNKYNRMVIYNASYYHQSSGYFGKNKEDCRLLQVFFFHTKKNDDVNKPAIEYRIDENANYKKIYTIEDNRGLLNRLKIKD
jgi:hypothetical protein